MKLLLLLSAFVFALGVARQAHGQILYDYLSRDVTSDIIRKNEINQNLMIGNLLAQHLQMQQIIQQQARGQQRIAAGQASNTFQPRPEASLLARIAPASRPAAGKLLEAFETAMRDRGYRRYDVADGRALAFVLSFYGYRGQDPGPERLGKIRAKFRDDLMQDLSFQGESDASRQSGYERTSYFAMLSVALRNQAMTSLGPAAGAERETLIKQAEYAGAEVLKTMFVGGPVEGIELTSEGFGDRGDRLVREGRATLTFRRSVAPSAAARHFESMRGAALRQSLLERFSALNRQRGGADSELADIWATAYAIMLQTREQGRLSVSSAGWTAARDYMLQWGLAQPDWARSNDDVRQNNAEKVALDAMWLVEQREVNRRELAAPPPTDPIKRVLWVRPADRTAALAEQAREMIERTFAAKERPAIEALLRR